MPRKQEPLTPKRVRDLLRRGRYVLESKRVPRPPEEWKPWKRAALARANEVAWMFIRGYRYSEMRRAMGNPEISRQRLAKMSARGIKFFLDRGWIRKKDRNTD